NRRGFFVFEAIVGMVLLMAIGTALVVTLHLRQQVHERADARRQAVDRAEAALVMLQNGERAEMPAVSLESLDSPAPAGFRWVRTRCSVNEQEAQLIGLVPAEEVVP